VVLSIVMSDSILVFLIATLFPLLLGVVIFFTYAILPVIPLLLGLGTIREKGCSWGIFFGFIISFTLFRIGFSGLIYVLRVPIDYFQIVGALFLALMGCMILRPRYSIWLREKSPSYQGVIYSALLGLAWSFWVGLFTLLPSDDFNIRMIDALVIYTTFVSGIVPGIVLVVLQKILSKIYPERHIRTIEIILGSLLILISLLLLFHIIPIAPREGIKID
jgi:threonine/homoserine/homoserine lactone efflux protein